MRKCFELIGGSHRKFWTVEVVGKCYLVTFGKIGTQGQTQVKSFASETAARNKAMDMIDQKTSKGYMQVAEDKHPGAPRVMIDSLRVDSAAMRPIPAPAPRQPRKQAEPAPTPETTPATIGGTARRIVIEKAS